jgi:hypothetical protein
MSSPSETDPVKCLVAFQQAQENEAAAIARKKNGTSNLQSIFFEMCALVDTANTNLNCVTSSPFIELGIETTDNEDISRPKIIAMRKACREVRDAVDRLATSMYTVNRLTADGCAQHTLNKRRRITVSNIVLDLQNSN